MEGLDLAGDDTAWPVCILRWVMPWPSAPAPPAWAKPMPARPEQPGAVVLRRASETHVRGMTERLPVVVFGARALLHEDPGFEHVRAYCPLPSRTDSALAAEGRTARADAAKDDGVLAAVRRPPADGRPAPMQRVCCSTRRCNQPPLGSNGSTNLDCARHASHSNFARSNVELTSVPYR